MRVRKLSLSGIERTKLFLGYVGENEHTQIRFDASCIYADNPGARAGLTMQNPAGTVFPIVLDADGNEIIWNVSASDVAIAGNGSYQLTFTDNDEIIKTFIGQLFVLKSLTSAGDIPTPIENWIDQANQKLSEVEAATESIDNMDASATKLSPDASPTVTVSDVDGHKHLAFGIPQGEKGDKGEKGDTYEVTPENIEEISSRVVQSATIEQYTEGMADQVEAAQQHARDAGDSATAADTAKKAAAQSAQDASQSATAADTSARNSAQSETNAGNSAQAADRSAQAASQSASNAAQSERNAADSAQDAHDVLDSIPEDYTALSEDVTDLKSAISYDITEITVDKGTLVPNEYVKYDTGEFLPYSGWSRTDYLPCYKYTQIKLSARAQYSAFYDSNHAYIAKADFYADTYLDVPANASFFAISGTTNGLSPVIVTAKFKGLGYVLNESVEKANNFTVTLKTISSEELLDSYLIGANGIPVASSTWVCSYEIEMPFDDVYGYDIHGTFYGTGGAVIYGSENQVLLAVIGNNVTDYGGTSMKTLQTVHVSYVQGAKYIRISGWKTNVSSASDLWVKGNTFNGTYEHIGSIEKNLKSINANISTTIAESKVLVIGDSISTDAYGSYKKWVTDLKEAGFFPVDTVNSSQHATGFVARYNSQPNDFITRLKAISNPSQFDLVIVFGGINDYIQNIPMGSESGTDYTVSFKPAVNEFFNYLMQNFTQARLCVLLPLRTYATWQNSVGEYQQAYGNYIKQVAQSYCLPVLNLTEESGFCPYIATFSNMWTLQPEGYQSHDGVHPNAEYERRFLAPMIKHFLQGLM